MAKPKKKYIEKDLKITGLDGSMAGKVAGLTLQSAEEREREKQEHRRKVLASYKRGMTQTEALAALDELTDIINYDEGLMDDAQKFLKVIMKAQDIRTEFQALVFSALFCATLHSGTATAYDIGRMLGKPGMFMIQHLSEIEELCEGERPLLSRSKRPYDCLANYAVRQDVFNAVVRNERYEPKSLRKKNVEAFLFEFNRMSSTFSDDDNYKNYLFNVNALLADNRHLPYVKKTFKAFRMDIESDAIDCGDEMRMFMLLCASAVRGWNRMDVCDLTQVVEQDNKLDAEIALRNNELSIFRKKLVEPGCDDGLADRKSVQLPQKVIKRFLPGVKSAQSKEISQTSVIRHDKIVKKELFYDDDFVKNVDDLRMLLQENKFKEIQTRMKAKGLTSGGFTVLMYGAPGVGKTEFCKQLARETGRDILQVNISEVKSMWVGESEKNVQAIFDNYKALCKGSQKAPILLFNEADAIINKRNSFSEQRAVDKMENSMINILLQNLEDMPLNSILIATSNLATKTLDSAFERRFMYKLAVPSPTPETRRKIWLSKLPDLAEDIAQTLAHKFEFSGGEIDNVVRRYSVEEILYGTPDDVLAKLTEMCHNEKLDRGNRKIGFSV